MLDDDKLLERNAVKQHWFTALFNSLELTLLSRNPFEPLLIERSAVKSPKMTKLDNKEKQYPPATFAKTELCLESRLPLIYRTQAVRLSFVQSFSVKTRKPLSFLGSIGRPSRRVMRKSRP